MEDHELIQRLEAKFRELTVTLYDTTVPPAEVDALVRPYLAEGVTFTDPWQQASGRQKYRLGAVGFHAMFRFDFELFQCHVHLEKEQRRGRALVDGVMQLRQFSPLFTYPLRTILVYEFELVGDPWNEPEPRFLIHHHEEMWSLADMLEELPLTGWFYRKVFRRAFSYGFLGASWLSGKAKRMMPELS